VQAVNHSTWWQIERAELQPNGAIAWVHVAESKTEHTALLVIGIQRWLTRTHRWGTKHQHSNHRPPMPVQVDDGSSSA
jgi:hypothetical protein